MNGERKTREIVTDWINKVFRRPEPLQEYKPPRTIPQRYENADDPWAEYAQMNELETIRLEGQNDDDYRKALLKETLERKKILNTAEILTGLKQSDFGEEETFVLTYAFSLRMPGDITDKYVENTYRQLSMRTEQVE